MEETSTKFTQISSFVNELANVKEQIITIKQYGDSKLKTKLSADDIKYA